MKRLLQRSAVTLALLTLMGGCGGAGNAPASVEDKAAIQASLETYLPRLAEAYRTGETSGLSEHAAAKEVASVEKRIRDLAREGRAVEAVFRELTLESVTVWGYANAYANTLEVWDVKVLARGSQELLAEEVGQRKRYQYQLKRQGASWQILYRSVKE